MRWLRCLRRTDLYYCIYRSLSSTDISNEINRSRCIICTLLRARSESIRGESGILEKAYTITPMRHTDFHNWMNETNVQGDAGSSQDISYVSVMFKYLDTRQMTHDSNDVSKVYVNVIWSEHMYRLDRPELLLSEASR